MSLLREVKDLISARKIILVHSKSDLDSKESIPGAIMVSSTKSTGLEELREKVVHEIAADAIVDPLQLPRGGTEKTQRSKNTHLTNQLWPQTLQYR